MPSLLTLFSSVNSYSVFKTWLESHLLVDTGAPVSCFLLCAPALPPFLGTCITLTSTKMYSPTKLRHGTCVLYGSLTELYLPSMLPCPQIWKTLDSSRWTQSFSEFSWSLWGLNSSSQVLPLLLLFSLSALDEGTDIVGRVVWFMALICPLPPSMLDKPSWALVISTLLCLNFQCPLLSGSVYTGHPVFHAEGTPFWAISVALI